MPRLGKLSLNFYHIELAGKACRRVQKSDNVRALIRQMLRLMQQHDGTGLSAPQVGVFLQLAVVRVPPSGATQVLINPEIVSWGGKDFLGTESCLSLPPTERAKANPQPLKTEGTFRDIKSRYSNPPSGRGRRPSAPSTA